MNIVRCLKPVLLTSKSRRRLLFTKKIKHGKILLSNKQDISYFKIGSKLQIKRFTKVRWIALSYFSILAAWSFTQWASPGFHRCCRRRSRLSRAWPGSWTSSGGSSTTRWWTAATRMRSSESTLRPEWTEARTFIWSRTTDLGTWLHTHSFQGHDELCS